MNDDTVRKKRHSKPASQRKKRVPAAAVYLTYEEQESLKMRRRLKQRLKTTKSTLHKSMGRDAKTIKARKAQKKILVDRKGRMAKERAQQEVENQNRHLLKRILKLHFRDGDASTGTAELPAAAGGAGKGTAPVFHRHADRRTSYMRQRYDALTRISQENKRMIGKLLTTKPAVETELEPTTRQKLGGSMMRPGHVGMMRALSGADRGIGGGNNNEQTRRRRPQSAPHGRLPTGSANRGRPTTAAVGRATYERQDPVPSRGGQMGKSRGRKGGGRPGSAIHLARRAPQPEDSDDEPDEQKGGDAVGLVLDEEDDE